MQGNHYLLNQLHNYHLRQVCLLAPLTFLAQETLPILHRDMKSFVQMESYPSLGHSIVQIHMP